MYIELGSKSSLFSPENLKSAIHIQCYNETIEAVVERKRKASCIGNSTITVGSVFGFPTLFNFYSRKKRKNKRVLVSISKSTVRRTVGLWFLPCVCLYSILKANKEATIIKRKTPMRSYWCLGSRRCCAMIKSLEFPLFFTMLYCQRGPPSLTN